MFVKHEGLLVYIKLSLKKSSLHITIIFIFIFYIINQV